MQERKIAAAARKRKFKFNNAGEVQNRKRFGQSKPFELRLHKILYCKKLEILSILYVQ